MAYIKRGIADDLVELFDEQMAKALELVNDERGVKLLYPLLRQINYSGEVEGRIPFLIVAQKPNISLAEQMAKVSLNDKNGISLLHEEDGRLADRLNKPAGYYIIEDVELGRSMLNTPPSVCLDQFNQDNRSGLTAVEGVALIANYPGILSEHSLDLVGSLYDGIFIPALFVQEATGMPTLGAFSVNNALAFCGSPSYARRLMPRCR